MPEHEPPRRRPAAETRAHVLDVAHELFYWQGIRATGVDRVAAAAGVAPTTLYRLFACKDDLVAAYVERAAEGYREWLSEYMSPRRCEACNGLRLRPASLAVRVKSFSIADFTSMSVARALVTARNWEFSRGV